MDGIAMGAEMASGQVTVVDLYKELVAMRQDMGKLLLKMERVDERNHQADQLHTDHEGRIRSSEHEISEMRPKVDALVKDQGDTEGRIRLLEKFRWQIAGALVVINVIAVLIEYLIVNHFK